MGTRYGMPRRWGTYEALPECQPYHVWSSLGAFMQMAAMLLVAAYLIYSLYRGRKAPANPWGGSTLEWTCPSPPPHDNFKTHPVVGNPYDHRGLEYDEKTDGYVRTNVGRIS
jgi:cytochrome c oxidase subunit 1